MMFGYGDYWGWSGMILMFVWWIVVIIAVVLAIRWLAGESGGRHHGNDAIKILKGRYAKGEIDKKEFEEKLNELKNN
ncbi:SHOCT domain-containing protein [Patescibacteria group bacterium]|nr:SHOCT domain-containing protein [Patescibacteria group bacterium]